MKFILVEDYSNIREVDFFEYWPAKVRNKEDAAKWFKETHPDYFIEGQSSSICLLLVDTNGSVLKVWDKYKGWYL